jgi:uncharacterized protein (UPF0548 family)
MFLLRRPSEQDIGRFLEHSRSAPLSYGPAGITRDGSPRGRVDEQLVRIGRGTTAFERARTALTEWKHLDLGWLQLFPANAPIDAGTTVAVRIQHLGFWSLNGARVVYGVDDETQGRFGFAYGTLANHAENGEELFEVRFDAKSGDVLYRLRAVSWPQAVLARVGYPFVRHLQARFRQDSPLAMQRATRQA